MPAENSLVQWGKLSALMSAGPDAVRTGPGWQAIRAGQGRSQKPGVRTQRSGVRAAFKTAGVSGFVGPAGLLNATLVKVDAANDLALLKAEGKFSPLPVAASRGVKLGGTVATVGFPNIGLQGFAPKLAP